MPTNSSLSSSQVRTLAFYLKGLNHNAVESANAIFGAGVCGDVDIDLEEVGRVFQCSHCRIWQQDTERAEECGEWCQSCMGRAIDGMVEAQERRWESGGY